MRYRMLGPLRLRNGTGWVPVTAEQQRIVLAVLLADAGRAVSTDRLVDAIWGDQPPRRAVNTIQAYVMRLRRLVPAGRLVTRAGGSELLTGGDDVDAARFERLVRAARRDLDQGRIEAGLARLRAALGLWRGPVFADVPASLALATCVTNLDQVRLATEEDLAASVLKLDRYEPAIDELCRMVDESPLRDARWALLMRAQLGRGRRAEALNTYQRARQVLRDQLGLEPGPDLRALQRAALTDDIAPPAM